MSKHRNRLEVASGRSPPDPSFLKSWAAIAGDAEHDFFLGSTWINAWLQTANPEGEWYLASSDGAPVAAAILSKPTRHWRNPLMDEYRLHETGNERTDGLFIEYNGILARPEFARDSLKAIISALRRKYAGPLQRLRSAQLIVSAASPSFTRLMQKTFPDMRIFHKEKSPYAALARLRSQRQDYLSALSGNARAQLRHARRDIETIGPLTLERAATVQQGLEFIRQLKPLHIARWRELGKPSAFDNPVFEPFLTALVTSGVPVGTVDILRACAGGKPFGYLVNFRHHGACLNYASGFAFDEFAQMKPGLVTHLLAIEDADRNGSASYNFLAGAARYKTSLSTDSDELCWLKLQL